MEAILEYLNLELIRIGPMSISALKVIKFVVFTFLLVYLSKKAKNWLVSRIQVTKELNRANAMAIATISYYILLFVGFMVLFQNVGINLSTLSVVAGAFSFGLGFGLQKVAANFVSGILLLIERPIKYGDRIEIGDRLGDVEQIGLRATTIRTNENINIVIPNSDFIDSQVINWSLVDKNVRLDVPLGTSYSSNPLNVREILIAVAAEHPDVLKQPPPEVIFLGFGDSSLDFTLRVWTNRLIRKPLVLKSDLYFKIFEAFGKHGIEIPFPQRDLHVRSGVLEIKKSKEGNDR